MVNDNKKYFDDINNWKTKNKTFKESVERKSLYKYLKLYEFLDVDLKIKNISPEVLVEVYKYFIRIRRFIFKWINQIEDYMTGIYIDKFCFENNKYNEEKLKGIIESTSLGKKNNEYFTKEESFFEAFKKHHKLAAEIINITDFKSRLKAILQLRNIICHNDLFFMNWIYLKKYNSLEQHLENIKSFIWVECLEGNDEEDWKAYDEQILKVESKIKNKDIKNEVEQIIVKIKKYKFEKKD